MSRTRKLLVLVGLGVIAAIALAQVASLRSPLDPAGADAETGLSLYPGDQGVQLPDIEGRTLEGDTLALNDLRGHVLVLNVWGSWCGPCRAEAPDLAEVSAETAPRGVRFVGIDVRDNPAAARAFARTYDITYPSLNDPKGQVLARFTGIIPVSAVPSTLVVDRSGTIRARIIGTVDASTLRGLIEDAEARS